MFRSSTIIRDLAKVIFMLKTFGEIMSLFIMRLCDSMMPHYTKNKSGNKNPHIFPSYIRFIRTK